MQLNNRLKKNYVNIPFHYFIDSPNSYNFEISGLKVISGVSTIPPYYVLIILIYFILKTDDSLHQKIV